MTLEFLDIHKSRKQSHTISEVMSMAKHGMKRPEWTHTQPKNTAAAVPEIQGKAKHGKTYANPIIVGTEGVPLKTFLAGKSDFRCLRGY